jgi:hypothetical protein
LSRAGSLGGHVEHQPGEFHPSREHRYRLLAGHGVLERLERDRAQRRARRQRGWRREIGAARYDAMKQALRQLGRDQIMNP